ncbi:MAG: J domain-containing protein [Acidimicrobiia bacterium]
MNDPFAAFGLTSDASIEEVRAARRRLAFESHPDRGGDERRMRELNQAFDAAIGHLTGRRPLGGVSGRDSPATEQSATPRSGASGDSGDPGASGAADAGGRPRRTVPWRDRVQHDAPSFVIEALPAEAFEALLVVTSWLGEVLVDEPPYLLDVHLGEPHDCWCRLELVPDAGSSTVSLTVAGVDGLAAPDVEMIRDVWVAELNRLGAAPPL